MVETKDLAKKIRLHLKEANIKTRLDIFKYKTGYDLIIINVFRMSTKNKQLCKKIADKLTCKEVKVTT